MILSKIKKELKTYMKYILSKKHHQIPIVRAVSWNFANLIKIIYIATQGKIQRQKLGKI